jgi:hypothetical protein
LVEKSEESINEFSKDKINIGNKDLLRSNSDED